MPLLDRHKIGLGKEMYLKLCITKTIAYVGTTKNKGPSWESNPGPHTCLLLHPKHVFYQLNYQAYSFLCAQKMLIQNYTVG